MKSFSLLCLLTFIIQIISCSDVLGEDVKLVRVKKNADGTMTELEQIDKMTIRRRTLTEKANGERIISSQTVYTKSEDGVLRNAKITDGAKRLIFKIRYGYHKMSGKLVMEELFDAQAVRVNNDGVEIPLQRLYYKYDAHGSRSKPYSITTSGKGTVETTWKKHIKERMDKMQLNLEEDTTLPSDEDLKKLEEANRALNKSFQP